MATTLRALARLNKALRTTSPVTLIGGTLTATWLLRYLWRLSCMRCVRSLILKRWQETQRERLGRILLTTSATARKGYRQFFIENMLSAKTTKKKWMAFGPLVKRLPQKGVSIDALRRTVRHWERVVNPPLTHTHFSGTIYSASFKVEGEDDDDGGGGGGGGDATSGKDAYYARKSPPKQQAVARTRTSMSSPSTAKSVDHPLLYLAAAQTNPAVDIDGDVVGSRGVVAKGRTQEEYIRLSHRLADLYTDCFKVSYLWNSLHANEFGVGDYVAYCVVQMVADMFGANDANDKAVADNDNDNDNAGGGGGGVTPSKATKSAAIANTTNEATAADAADGTKGDVDAVDGDEDENDDLPDEEVDNDVMGFVTSGGTESLMCALRAYREWGTVNKGLAPGEATVIAFDSVHAAVMKAGTAYHINVILIPCARDGTGDLAAMAAAAATHKDTLVAVVASTPSYACGVMDDVAAIAEIALQNNAGCHVDACLGGFVVNFLKDIAPLPSSATTNKVAAAAAARARFLDVPGVTSLSADTHKNVRRELLFLCTL
jgi:hypothetical protein